jgi:hypothetical protein
MELENHMSQSMCCQLDEATSASGLQQDWSKRFLMALDRKATIPLDSIFFLARWLDYRVLVHVYVHSTTSSDSSLYSLNRMQHLFVLPK